MNGPKSELLSFGLHVILLLTPSSAAEMYHNLSSNFETLKPLEVGHRSPYVTLFPT